MHRNMAIRERSQAGLEGMKTAETEVTSTFPKNGGTAMLL